MDIYDIKPKLSRLDKETLSNSDQIVVTDSNIILVYDINNNEEFEYNPHLLFFDRCDLRLKAAKYFPSEKIEKIENDTIKFYTNKHRLGRTKFFRNELPTKYHLLELKDKPRTSDNLVKKYIKSIEVDTSNFDVLFHTKYFNSNELSSKEYESHYSISDLTFHHTSDCISIRKLDTLHQTLQWENLYIESRLSIDFFTSLLVYLQNSAKTCFE